MQSFSRTTERMATFGGAERSTTTTGTTRNRTELFIKYRRQSRSLNRPFAPYEPKEGDGDGMETARLVASAIGNGSIDVEAGLGDGGLSSTSDSVPEYVKFKEGISRDMEEIRQGMAELRSLHGKASLSSFEDSREEEVAVEVVTQQITRLFRRCERKLRTFSKVGRPANVDDAVQRNVQRTLARDLQQLSVQFRKQQKQYLQRLRAKDVDGVHPDDASYSSTYLTKIDASDESALLGYDPGFSDVQLQEADSMTAVIDERDREVQNVLKSIGELGQIMKDLSTLVIDQGTVLDRIDYNLEQTTSRVEQGVRQLRRAERAQRRGAMASCVMVLTVAVIAMLVVVLFKVAFL